ncbi:hypothetical protein L2E82_31781 [Cichorium intybus]|uniref:Uncharacterized protein n=1 Tax=Cichorium intybus TaxID=13427 RepID=A0ACB9BE61_CICIN|nr:hypothetical protein L2E82_31781 [Cichorium intybus]
MRSDEHENSGPRKKEAAMGRCICVCDADYGITCNRESRSGDGISDFDLQMAKGEGNDIIGEVIKWIGDEGRWRSPSGEESWPSSDLLISPVERMKRDKGNDCTPLAKPAAGRLIIGTIALLTASTSSEDPVVGGNTYMTYLITTWTNIPELNGTEISLRRRFKDFVTLSDRLFDSYREFFFR